MKIKLKIEIEIKIIYNIKKYRSNKDKIQIQQK